MQKKEDAKSHYYRVKCSDCGGDQIIYDSIASKVKCISCGKVLAEPSGGKATLFTKEVLRLD